MRRSFGSRRARQFGFRATVLALVLVAVIPASAMAKVSYSGTVNTIQAVPAWKGNWYGGILASAGPSDLSVQQDRGSWQVTAWLGKANGTADASNLYDWYEVEVAVTWKTTNHNIHDSLGMLVIEPTGATIKSLTASPSRVGKDCSKPVSVTLGTSYGFLSGGVTIAPQICSNTTVTLEYSSLAQSRWSTNDVGDTAVWDEVVEVKVPQGQKPGFNITIIYPSYTAYYDYYNLQAKYDKLWHSSTKLLNATTP